jgi:hypothetical protein
MWQTARSISGDQSLDSVTSSCGVFCTYKYIIIRKGFYNLEIMPKPVLVLPEESKSKMKDFNGIAVAGIDELNGLNHKQDQVQH